MNSSSFVDNLTTKHKVVVFAKKTCPYCIRAIEELESRKAKDMRIEYLDSLKKNDYDSLMDYFKETTKARSVPRIYIDNQCIGGCDDLMKKIENKSLDKLLE